MKQPVKLGIAMMLFIMMIKLASAQNSVPQLINYQGFLTDQDGKALTGNYQLTFSIYQEASGDNPWLWQETHDAVNVEGGLFDILLGSVDTLTVDVFTGDRFLGITMAGEVEMEPRLRLASVAFSLRSDEANNAGTLDNMDSEEFVAVAGDSMTGTLTIDDGDINVNGKVKEIGNDLLPRGVIVMWSGTLDSIPAGWAICNGDSGTPDLTNRFIYGVNAGEDPGGVGGASSHFHTTSIPQLTTNPATGTAGTWGAYQNKGEVVTHTHTINAQTRDSDTKSNLPPYYKLAFIMKL
jgi:hypothetical protein